MTLFHWVLCFYFYACAGWLMEEGFYLLSTHKIVNRGFLHGPFCPIYGAGAVAMAYLCTPISQFPLLVFFIGASAATALEYATDYLLEKLFHTRCWDYTGFFLNLHGRVCLLFSAAWGLLCLGLVSLVHPAVSGAFQAVAPQDAMLASLTLTAALLLDAFIAAGSTGSLPRPVWAARLFQRAAQALPEHLRRRENRFTQIAFLHRLEVRYLQMAVRREWDSMTTQRLSCAFPFFTAQKVRESAQALWLSLQRVRRR